MIFKIADSNDVRYLDLQYDLDTNKKTTIVTLKFVDVLKNPIKNGNIISITENGEVFIHPNINKNSGIKLSKQGHPIIHYFYEEGDYKSITSYFTSNRNKKEE